MHYNSVINEKIKDLAGVCKNIERFSEETYSKNQVKRGLRDIDGTGVIAGLTDISDVIAKKVVDGKKEPCPGELYYRGINVKDMINMYDEKNRHGFEEATYLLLFNKLPNKQELTEFKQILAEYRKLPKNFVREIGRAHV